MTHNPVNQVIRQETLVEKNANNKKKFENQPKDNRVPQQPPFKKPDVARAYTIEANGKKAYAGNLSYCNKYFKRNSTRDTSKSAINHQTIPLLLHLKMILENVNNNVGEARIETTFNPKHEKAQYRANSVEAIVSICRE
ncbi:hypothetical protein Tco_0497639 [Tanacetum coccineum]